MKWTKWNPIASSSMTRATHARTLISPLLVIGLIVSFGIGASGCKHSPPNLNPQARVAWYGIQTIHNLDRIRDIAIDANRQSPPLISERDTRKIVDWHTSAVKTIQASPGGWRATVEVGLNELVRDLPPDVRALISPYVQFAIGVMKGAN